MNDDLTQEIKNIDPDGAVAENLVKATVSKSQQAADAFDEKQKFWPWQIMLEILTRNGSRGLSFLCDSEDEYEEIIERIKDQFARRTGFLEVHNVDIRGASKKVDLVFNSENVIAVICGQPEDDDEYEDNENV